MHGDGYMRGMHDQQRGFHEEAVWKDAGRVSREAILRVQPELKTALREIGAAGYDRGYGDAAAGRGKAPGWPPRSPSDRGPGDAVQYLQSDATAKAYARGFDDRFPRGEPGRSRRPAPAGGDLFSNSEFELNRESCGGILSVWSRSSRSNFSGIEGALSLNGEVRTTMVGADYSRGALTVGLSVGHTLGMGGYRGTSGGQVSTSITGFYPWVGYQVNDRVFSLAFKADALWVGAASELLDGPTGRLNALGGRGDAGAHGAGGLAGLHARRRPAVADAERRGGSAPRRRRCRHGRGHGCRRRPRVHRHGDGAVAGRAGAHPGSASGRRVHRARDVAVVRVGPDAVEPAGPDRAGGPVVGRAGAGRRRGAVEQPDGLRHGARSRCTGPATASTRRWATGCR